MPPVISAAKKAPSLKLLIARLNDVQASFNDIWRFVEYYEENATVTDVDIRLEKVDELWEKFCDTLVEIRAHEDYLADEESYDKDRQEFSDRYYRAKSFLVDKSKKLQGPMGLEQSVRMNDSVVYGVDRVRLPQISLPSFNGDIDEWLSFRDLFTSLIHHKTELPEVEKFHYLKGCLQGEPKSLIDPLKITRANYQIAWDMLLKRFDNSKQLRKRQVQSLFKLPTLTKESVSELHILLEGFERVVKNLDQVIEPEDYKDLLLVHILTARLDPVTRRGWEEFSTSKEQDTLSDLTDFIRRRVQMLESLPSKSVDVKGPNPLQQFSKPRTAFTKTNYSSMQSFEGRCVACKGEHLLYQCQVFHRLEVAERDALLRTHSLCRNCFRVGHQAKDCKSKFSCRKCQGRHHTLVCFKTEREGFMKGTVVAKGKESGSKASTSTQTANVSTKTVCTTQQFSSQVLLATAVVLMVDDSGQVFPARALLDSGSESNFISERLSQRMCVSRERVVNQSIQVNCNISASGNLESLVARFWEYEEIGVSNYYSPEETRCAEHFERTVQRGIDGRFTVTLPKDEGVLRRLGKSKEIALRRLQGTERRLLRDTLLRDQYLAFMQEYLQLGHMRRVDKVSDEVQRCYLPHHPVVKETSTTTKLRVVFDASCKTSTGVSLNDGLLVGPVIQEDLRSIILRCRTKQIMLVADVEKMFRQINICQRDKPLQSILWRSSPDDEPETYELGTVTYGTKPAPFLATRTLKQLAMEEVSRFPLAAKAVCEDTYMDDIITGADAADLAIELRMQLDKMMSAGGFHLRKWASSSQLVLEGIKEENLAIRDLEGINLDPDPSVKTLGLTWLPKTDTLKFQFNIPLPITTTALSKRQILSVIATLFDPLGLLGVTITRAKIFMQMLWTLKDEKDERMNWDTPVPSTVGEIWRSYHRQLSLLNEIRIERCVIIPDPILVEIHCFSDASEKAYGACVYIKSMDSSGSIRVRLLSSKSRVAPLKSQSIPRLELCGALLAVLLFEKIHDSTRISAQTYFWTDSTCVLHWIASSPSNWNVFVANRVAKIQTLSEGCHWRHVAGVDNPADLISRGISPEDVIGNTIWWQGPAWLEKGPDYWPTFPENLVADEGDEERRRVISTNVASEKVDSNDWYFAKFGAFVDLIRRTACWLRLIKLLREPKNTHKDTTFLSTSELKEAERLLISKVQQECFYPEWRTLSKGETIPRKSPLRWYNPYISTDGLIRVGGRLKHSKESEDKKHPIVLPARHHFTRLIIRHYHEKLLHAGPQLLLGAIRLRYWPLGGRNLARYTVHHCQKCYRSKPSAIQQFMGELPSARVTVSRPFSRTGVDYFGPLYLRLAPRRPAVKAYVAIFVCMCTKAVHLELVSDLSTDRFLQALRRFISRRGMCTDIYSDNGTNFIGARNKLREVLKLLRDSSHRNQVDKECSNQGIQWHFNPPSAPHFGGLWEAAVRSAKNHLLKVLGESVATPEDMSTLLVQVEGCLNSRPLTQMSEDPNDLEPLTPAHFLIGTSLQAIPEENVETMPTNRLNYWQLIQKRLQDFWKRWRRDYLAQLQGRMKRWKPPVDIVVGRLVIIQDDNQPPMRWKMGRIMEVHPGDDGIVRVVTLKTSAGILKRPVEKLCVLPIEEPSN
ncbi:uncharacterized protein LOC129770600 [Toxorhynchites rutilus septentrionalis]|uniref:uncharacterized protein LOC129770600 n=1 Tax=Toxorhynchites rutilus septentrionalis TaxID=329112 RepID=UPI00247B0FA9|nr:uncharacterized protein LOC129770600 [Toxorhynchites rutilus septentrionalis]XP_055629520.1 uncharacterized protein LOC129770600 [Toxorhynchites rutilus septentrionalis]